jgi:DNA-binding CsgD family transcriptional regulator
LNPKGPPPKEGTLRNESKTPPVTEADEIAPQLSPREQSILRCLVGGDSNKSIARKIDIAEATVKVHVKAILRKIRVHNRTQAAIWGMNNGSLTPTGNTNPPLLASGQSRRAPAATETIEIKQTDELMRLAATEAEANHAAIPHLDRLVRRGAVRRHE